MGIVERKFKLQEKEGNKQEEKDKREKSAALQRELGWGRMLIFVKAGNVEKAQKKKKVYTLQFTIDPSFWPI